MKRSIAGILLILLLLPFACTVVSAATPSPTASFYVNDSAGVLSSAQEAKMLSAAEALAKQTGAQVVVLTVTSLDGKAIEEYALEIARDWGIGDKDEDNGVLILLSTGDREIRVEVGYGLEGCLPDGKTGRLIDTYAIPYYAENDFSAGTEQLFYAVLNVVCEEYGIDPASLDVPVMDTAEEEATVWDLIYLGAAVIGFVVIMILTRGRALIFLGFGGFGRGGHGGGGGRNFGGGGSFGGGGAGRRF